MFDPVLPEIGLQHGVRRRSEADVLRILVRTGDVGDQHPDITVLSAGDSPLLVERELHIDPVLGSHLRDLTLSRSSAVPVSQRNLHGFHIPFHIVGVVGHPL